MNLSIHRIPRLTRLLSPMIIVLIAMILFLLPSINVSQLIQGTTTGKMFFFLYLITFIGFLLLLKTIINFPIKIRFSKIDGLLVIWIGYILLNSLFKQIPISNRLLELSGLIIFYIALRQIKLSKWRILLFAIIIGSTIQAVYGSLQLWDYFPSQHGQFKMTGSFFNPGPFAGYLASVFPIALGLFLFRISPFSTLNKKLNQIINSTRYHILYKLKPVKLTNETLGVAIVIVALISILMVLPASLSRAAWLAVSVSSIMLLLVRYPIVQWLKKHSRLKCGAILVLVCIAVGAGLLGIYQLKSGSISGRLLIWKVTSGIVVNHPLTGVGFDNFKAVYMDEQSNYFKQQPESPEAMIAGDTNYCFNEFLQHTAENGLIGLILMLVTLANVFRVSNKSSYQLGWIAKAGVAGIVVFALFSYPTQILPIKINLTCYLACLSSIEGGKTWRIPIGKYILTKCILAGFMIGGIIVSIKHLTIYHEAYKNWSQANQFYMMGKYPTSLNYNEMAWNSLKTNGDYLTNYGKALNMAGKHEKAIEVLLQATTYYPNIIVYTTLGDSYKALKKTVEAEQSYLKAWYMNPSRFYPKYLLAKLYNETGQKEKATVIASELLNKEVKIQSMAINQIREEMESILQSRTTK